MSRGWSAAVWVGSVVAALGLLLGALVLAAPRIGEAELAASKLVFDQVNITDPDETGFTITARARLWDLGPTDGSIDAFEASMYFGDVVFGRTVLPAVSDAKANEVNHLVLSSRVHVTEPLYFTLYATALLSEVQVPLRMTGVTTVHSRLWGNTWVTVRGVKFDKSVTVEGAAGLKESNVTSVSLADSTPSAAVLELGVGLYNPSNVNILGLGTICLDLFANDTLAGAMATTQSVDLLEGWNALQFRGQLVDTDPVTVGHLISQFVAGNDSAVAAEGRECAGTTPLFRAAVATMYLATELPGSSVPLVHGMEVTGLEMTPDGADPLNVALALNATITINSVLGANSPITVDQVALNAALTNGRATLGQLDIPTTVIRQPGTVTTTPVAKKATQMHATTRAHSHPSPPPLRARLPGIPPPPTVPVNVSLALAGTLRLAGDGSSFDSFVDAFLQAPAVSVGLESGGAAAMQVQLTSALGTLTVAVPIHVATEMPGANKFSANLEVLRFDVDGPTADGKGLVVVTDVVIDNPSPVTVSMGEVAEFEIRSLPEDAGKDGPEKTQGPRLGVMRLYNTTVVPGPNRVNMTGELRPAEYAGGLEGASELFSRYLNGLNTTVQVHGLEIVMPNGALTPSWLAAAVANLTLEPQLPGAVGLRLLSNISIGAMHVSVVPGSDGDFVASARVDAVVHVPFTNVPFDVLLANVSLDYVDPASGVAMAHIEATNEHVAYSPFARPQGPGPYPATGNLSLFIDPPVPVRILDADLFADFIAGAITEPVVVVDVAGQASETLQLPVGVLDISNVSCAERVSIPGMDGVHIAFLDILVLDSSGPDSVIFLGHLNFSNPSPIGADVGPVVLDLYVGGYRMGNASVDSLSLPGRSTVPVTVLAYLVRPASAAGQDLLREVVGAYLRGESSPVTFQGSLDSSPYPIVARALAQLQSNSSLPGVGAQLVVNGTLILSDWAGGELNGMIALQNPTTHEIDVIDAKLFVYMCAVLNASDPRLCDQWGDLIGLVTNIDISQDPIILPALALVQSRPIPIQWDASFLDVIDVFIQLAEDGDVTPTLVVGNLTARIGDFAQNVDYRAVNVPLSVIL